MQAEKKNESGKEFHTWTEVCIEKNGWVVLEMLSKVFTSENV